MSRRLENLNQILTSNCCPEGVQWQQLEGTVDTGTAIIYGGGKRRMKGVYIRTLSEDAGSVALLMLYGEGNILAAPGSYWPAEQERVA